jgi:hypothetical protein
VTTGSARSTRACHDDRGSVLLLGIGMVMVCVLAIAVLADASAAFLQRQQLMAVADAAALAAAQAIDLPAYYEQGATPSTSLRPDAVPARVEAYLGRSRAASVIDGLRVERAWSDGRQVLVALSCPLHLPFLPGLLSSTVNVESWAQLAYRDTP